MTGYWIRGKSTDKWRVVAKADTLVELRELVRLLLTHYIVWR